MNWAYLLLVAVAVGAAAIILLKRSKRTIRMQTVQLVEKDKITHDTFLFTFLLNDQTQSLGLKVGEHIEVRYQLYQAELKSAMKSLRENILPSQRSARRDRSIC